LGRTSQQAAPATGLRARRDPRRRRVGSVAVYFLERHVKNGVIVVAGSAGAIASFLQEATSSG
jgi:hypothetical protein